MGDSEEDELIAREYAEHWKSLHSADSKERDEVLAWLKKRRLRLIADAGKKDGTPRANGARALLNFIANIGKK